MVNSAASPAGEESCDCWRPEKNAGPMPFGLRDSLMTELFLTVPETKHVGR